MKEELIIKAIGGYSVIGRNMTVAQYGNESVILDMGIFLDRYIAVQDSGKDMTEDLLIDNEAIPNDREFYAKHGKTVKAIVLGHAHLDHIGAVRWLASKYDCPLIASPYTIRLIEKMSKDDRWKIRNKLVPLNLNSKYKISENLTVELVYVTHSTLQCAITVIHTPKGAVVYTPDYKLDHNPTLGQKTNTKRLRALGKEKVAAVLVDCTQADQEGHTFSEKVAREMLKDVLSNLNDKNHAIIVTTFSSHISRLQSVLDWGQLIGREVVFVGRSLSRYIGAAEDLGLVNFSSKAQIKSGGRDYRSFLKEANARRGKYLIAMTGNQGEPNALLPRIAKDELPFSILPGDCVIFSCRTIPTPMIQANRRLLEQQLLRKKARIFKDVHVSGHAGKEDHRDLIKILRPDNVIPCHGDMAKMSSLVELASSIGYSLGDNIHLLQEGQEMKI
jgi:ribonuclease J